MLCAADWGSIERCLHLLSTIFNDVMEPATQTQIYLIAIDVADQGNSKSRIARYLHVMARSPEILNVLSLGSVYPCIVRLICLL